MTQTDKEREAWDEILQHKWLKPDGSAERYAQLGIADFAFKKGLEAARAQQPAAPAEVVERVMALLKKLRDEELEKYPWTQGWGAQEPEEAAQEKSPLYRECVELLSALTALPQKQVGEVTDINVGQRKSTDIVLGTRLPTTEEIAAFNSEPKQIKVIEELPLQIPPREIAVPIIEAAIAEPWKGSFYKGGARAYADRAYTAFVKLLEGK